MSLAGYEEYGKRFLESWRRYWPEDIPLSVFSEDDLPGVPTNNLNADDDLTEFLASAPVSPDYRWNAAKFAKKVFALTSPMRPICDRWIWIDADTETTAVIDHGFLADCCPEHCMGSYLGRKNWPHSECGFVVYNLEKAARSFLAEFRQYYTSGAIYSLPEWHDSYVFDVVRDAYEKRGHEWHNLSAGCEDMHPWDSSILGERMKHYKGPLRKAGRDGNVPSQYWSQKEQRDKEA